jgi:DNA primase
MANEAHLKALKAAADPLRIAAALGLRSRGGRFFCPVCQPEGGKTPDLVLNQEGFFCHKCGLKGDLLTLIEAVLQIDFPSAVAWLEKETGIPSPGHHRRKAGEDEDKGQRKIVQPGASWKAVSADPDIYEAFLSSCRPVEGRAQDFLIKKGIAEDVIIAQGLRFCGKEYQDIMNALTIRFGKEKVTTSGLGSFAYYFRKKAGFLVFPYQKNGRPVYLKVRPPVSKEDAERLGLIRFMNSAAAVPCLYNADALNGKPEKVLICEGETDTLTALSYGFQAVGTPGAKGFKKEWIESFRDIQDGKGRSRVYLVLDADEAGQAGERVIADLFLKAGLPIPLKLELPPGMDLTDFMKNGKTL